jgi:hypothetical protein
MMKVRGRREGAGRQSVHAFQMRCQSIGCDQQRDREQNTQKFHAVTVAFSKDYEIGVQPFLLSVFG